MLNSQSYPLILEIVYLKSLDGGDMNIGIFGVYINLSFLSMYYALEGSTQLFVGIQSLQPPCLKQAKHYLHVPLSFFTSQTADYLFYNYKFS